MVTSIKKHTFFKYIVDIAYLSILYLIIIFYRNFILIIIFYQTFNIVTQKNIFLAEPST